MFVLTECSLTIEFVIAEVLLTNDIFVFKETSICSYKKNKVQNLDSKIDLTTFLSIISIADEHIFHIFYNEIYYVLHLIDFQG
jgi:hypothetical protein